MMTPRPLSISVISQTYQVHLILFKCNILFKLKELNPLMYMQNENRYKTRHFTSVASELDAKPTVAIADPTIAKFLSPNRTVKIPATVP